MKSSFQLSNEAVVLTSAIGSEQRPNKVKLEITTSTSVATCTYAAKESVSHNRNFLQQTRFMDVHESHDRELGIYDDSDSESDFMTTSTTKSIYAAHILACFSLNQHSIHEEKNYKITIPGSMLRNELEGYLELLTQMHVAYAVNDNSYDIGTVLNTDRFPILSIRKTMGVGSVVVDTTSLKRLSSNHQIDIRERAYPMQPFVVTLWGHRQQGWKKIQSIGYEEESDSFMTTIEDTSEYDFFVIGCEEPSILVKFRFATNARTSVHRQKVVSIFQSKSNGLVRKVVTNENGIFTTSITVGDELSFMLHHDHQSRLVITGQELMETMQYIYPTRYYDSYDNPVRYDIYHNMLTISLGIDVHHIVIGKILNNPKLSAVYHSSDAKGYALHGLLDTVEDILTDHSQHPGYIDHCADLVVEHVQKIADSSAMMNALTSQANDHNNGFNKQGWLTNYLPSYVDHHEAVLGGQDPGIVRIPRVNMSICVDHQDQIVNEVDGLASDLQVLNVHNMLSSSDVQPPSVFTALSSLASSSTPASKKAYEYNQSTLRKELSDHRVPVHTLENYVRNVYQQCDTTHKTVVRAYTGDWIYRELNQVIRQHGVSSSSLPQFEQTANALSAALCSLPLEVNLPGNNLVLYRGQNFTGDAEYQVGDEVAWHAFSSTTTNRNVAEAFAGYGYLFEIYGVTPDICASVSKFSVYPNEEEILLNRGTMFRVESTSSSHPRVIRLRVIPSNGMKHPMPNPEVNLTPVSVSAGIPTDTNNEIVRGNSCECPLCQFEGCIGGSPGQSCNESKALQMIQDPNFVSLVMNSTRHQFSTRMPYFYQSSVKVPVTDNLKRRPWLYLACRNNLPQVARQLLSLGANPLDTIDVGSTALHAAAFYSHRECVEVLLHSTAATTRRTLVNMKNRMSGSGATAADEASDPSIRSMIRAYM